MSKDRHPSATPVLCTYSFTDRLLAVKHMVINQALQCFNGLMQLKKYCFT